MSIADEIHRLNELRASGAITDEEFAAAKERLLGARPAGAADIGAETRKWAMFIHFSQFAGIVVPLAGLVVPIVLWQIKKAELPGVDAHGKMVTNWIISLIIYAIASAILALAIIGFFMLAALAIVAIVFPIIGGLKANEGELWTYPLTITFIR